MRSRSGAHASAGPPTPTQVLLCGTFVPGGDRFSGATDIDHPSGSTAMGTEYAYSGQNCESEYKQPGDGMFTWTISHSNVNTVTELGTEHGIATLTNTDSQTDGFNGRITNYDFPASPPAPDACGNRDIYYASGHQEFDPTPCAPSAPGNFNTQGGASTGQHFNGKYGTLVYQDNTPTDPNYAKSPCQSGSGTYCFQAIIVGQTN